MKLYLKKWAICFTFTHFYYMKFDIHAPDFVLSCDNHLTVKLPHILCVRRNLEAKLQPFRRERFFPERI